MYWPDSGEEAQVWAARRNTENGRIDWRFTTDNARINLKHLYPTVGG